MVFALRKSAAATSRFVRPCATCSAICSSWAVSSSVAMGFAAGAGKTNAASEPAEVSTRSRRTVAGPRRVSSGPLTKPSPPTPKKRTHISPVSRVSESGPTAMKTSPRRLKTAMIAVSRQNLTPRRGFGTSGPTRLRRG